MKSYKILIDKYKTQDRSAFVLGAGTSLYNCWRNFRFEEIYNYVVVSVNSTIVVTSWEEGKPDNRYWISNDALCIRWTWWKDVKKSKCIKIVRNSWLKHKSEIKDFLIFKPRPTSEGIINPKHKGLAYCSSIPSGIDLCLQMGCKKIFLLGVDHYDVGGKTHFWQLMPEKHHQRQLKPAQGPFSQQKRVFPINNLAYKALLGFADFKGAKIYNCNLNSVVDIFEKINFERGLNIAKKNKCGK